MHEPTLDLGQVNWSHQKEVVRIFYKEMWDHANTALVPQIFHPDFTFRGSLGPQLVGHEQFIGYVKFVTGALDHYTSDILALGEEGNQSLGSFASMVTTGENSLRFSRLGVTFGGMAPQSSRLTASW